jgi:hypothetical protein
MTIGDPVLRMTILHAVVREFELILLEKEQERRVCEW